MGPELASHRLGRPEPATITRPLELLLETLLARSTAGNVDADAFEIAEATDLASVAINISLQLAAAEHRLHELAVVVSDDGQFAIAGGEPEVRATASIDISAYQRADQDDWLRLRPQPLTGSPVRLTRCLLRHARIRLAAGPLGTEIAAERRPGHEGRPRYRHRRLESCARHCGHLETRH